MKLEHAIGKLDAHIVECGAEKRDLSEAIKGVRSDINEFKALPMKAVRWLGSIIVIAAVTLLTQNFILHQESTAKASQAASEASVAAGTGNQVLSVVRGIKAAQTNSTGP